MDEWHYLGAESDYHKIHYASQQSKAMGIELHATDGSGHFRIPAGKDKGKVLDENGFYDYYAEASYDNQAHWRKKLGEFAMKWLLHPSVVLNRDMCILKKLPAGYKLYTHYKYQGEDERTDHYLLGSRHVHQFRSPEEFYLHFRWLIIGMLVNSEGLPDCGCTYCSGTPQREISIRYAHRRLRNPLGSDHDTDDESKKPAREKSKKANKLPLPLPLPIKDYRNLASSSSAPSRSFPTSTSNPELVSSPSAPSLSTGPAP